MDKQYLANLIHAVVAFGFAASALIISVVLGKAGKRNPTIGADSCSTNAACSRKAMARSRVASA